MKSEANAKVYPASITKLMNAYTALQYLDASSVLTMGSDVLAYTYPNAAKPVCYINNLKLTGATLASNIAHEAWHAYQAKNDMAVNEQGAEIYEAKVLNLLLREQRVYNGTIHLYE